MKSRFMSFVLLAVVALCASGCSRVPPGYVGIKVNLLGGEKGVESEQLGVGRYWIGMNEELYLFPTFVQNYVWTLSPAEGSSNDESITFQTKEGMSVNADVGISYAVRPEKVPLVFQKYRKQLGEITDVYLRNEVRDAFTHAASTLPVESVYGEGKAAMLKSVEDKVRSRVSEYFDIDKVYLVGDLRLPDAVITALNNKIRATQEAEQKENELRTSKAEAEKTVAIANGTSRAILVEAEAQAKANELIARSLTPELVQYQAIKSWNGALPTTTGGVVPFINIK